MTKREVFVTDGEIKIYTISDEDRKQEVYCKTNNKFYFGRKKKQARRLLL